MRRSLFVLTVLALAGCSGATFDDVYNEPDSLDWTYFEAEPQAVINAIQEAYALSAIRVESVQEDDVLGGLVVTLSQRRGSARPSQILIQSTTVEGYQSRAQLYPDRDPLPRSLEAAISGRA